MTGDECVTCSVPGETFCERCAVFDGNGTLLAARWYCSPLCRELDQGKHQTVCRSGETPGELFERAQRAGEVAQMLFYAFIENTWAYDMSDIRVVSDRHDELVAIEVLDGPGRNTGPGGESTCYQNAGGWLVSFPGIHFMPADCKAKRSLLADQHSVWAFVFMKVAIQTLFQDIVKDSKNDIKEIVHYLPNTARRMVQHKGRFGFKTSVRDDLPYPDEDGNGDLKGVYRITLQDGTDIALDLTGAQYSLSHDAVMPWAIYLDRWVSLMKYRLPLGSHYKKHVENMSDYHSITHLTVILEQMKLFDSFIENWKPAMGIGVHNVSAEIDIVSFREQTHRLLIDAEDYLQHLPRALDDRSPSTLVGSIDLRHPKAIENLAAITDNECGEFVLPDLGPMDKFDWSKFSKMIQMPGNVVPLVEKKRARFLLKNRCVYKLPGNWRLVFMVDRLPSAKVPLQYISENPFWRRR